MQKENRLRRRKEFTRVYREGRSFVNKYLVLYVLPNQMPGNRFGFTVGKKLGKAVARNRLRRQLREICRLHMGELAVGYDLVIIPRQPAAQAEFDTLRRALRHLLHKSGIIRNEKRKIRGEEG